MSTDNGIWLCQRCAKLIDNDVSRHTKELLRRWKVAAEAAADRALKGTPPVEFFPQPSAALHTPIPNIQGLPYENARPLLINAGWQPRGYSMGHGSEPTLQYGNGQYFWDKGFHEIMDACPTGLAHCRFRYDDVYGNRLVVTTSGMVSLESEATAHISSWRFEDYG